MPQVLPVEVLGNGRFIIATGNVPAPAIAQGGNTLIIAVIQVLYVPVSYIVLFLVALMDVRINDVMAMVMVMVFSFMETDELVYVDVNDVHVVIVLSAFLVDILSVSGDEVQGYVNC